MSTTEWIAIGVVAAVAIGLIVYFLTRSSSTPPNPQPLTPPGPDPSYNPTDAPPYTFKGQDPKDRR